MNKIKQHGRECADIKYKIEMALGIGYKGRRADATKAKRIYCQVCRELGYSTTEIGIPFEWDHTVVCYHLRKLRSDEIETAHTLSSQLKSPTPPPPQIIVKEKTKIAPNSHKEDILTLYGVPECLDRITEKEKLNLLNMLDCGAIAADSLNRIAHSEGFFVEIPKGLRDALKSGKAALDKSSKNPGSLASKGTS